MDKNLKTALKMRFEYYNLYEGKEELWHEKYKNHNLYSVVVKSFEYDYKQIGEILPELLKDLKGLQINLMDKINKFEVPYEDYKPKE